MSYLLDDIAVVKTALAASERRADLAEADAARAKAMVSDDELWREHGTPLGFDARRIESSLEQSSI